MMAILKIEVIVSAALAAVIPLLGEVVDGPWALLGQVPAVGALVWVLWHLLTKTLPAQQESFRASLTDMAERHERWETQRHADSQQLTDTLGQLREHCAGHIAAREREAAEKQ